MSSSRLVAWLAVLAPGAAIAAEPVAGSVQQQPLNYNAIGMFSVVVMLTLGITYWAARRTRSTDDFYAAGGGISAGQNGFALAGDYMSAAALLGGTGLVYASGFDSLIFSIGATIGWPLMLFVIAERLRNLGKYTFADVISFRLEPVRSRSIAATGGLVVVIFDRPDGRCQAHSLCSDRPCHRVGTRGRLLIARVVSGECLRRRGCRSSRPADAALRHAGAFPSCFG
jgi:hypothetical protein